MTNQGMQLMHVTMSTLLHTERVECYMLLVPGDPARTSSRIVSLSPFVSSVDSTTVYLQTTCQRFAEVAVDGFHS